MSATKMAQVPTEIISLPSKGYFYPTDNKLSSGKIELKYMTAKEEDILTSQNLIRQGIVIETLLRELVVDDDIDMESMLLGDKNAIMVVSRIFGYGGEYSFEIDCPACGEHRKDSCDLTKFKDIEIDFSKLEKGKNEFEFKLPVSEHTITFKLLTQKDQKQIDAKIKSQKKIIRNSGIDSEVTTRLKQTIIAIDGNESLSNINSFVDTEFLSKDSFAFRAYLNSVNPDVDMTYNFECQLCGHTEGIGVPIGLSFFWPSARK